MVGSLLCTSPTMFVGAISGPVSVIVETPALLVKTIYVLALRAHVDACHERQLESAPAPTE